MLGETVRTVADATGGMSVGTFLAIIGVLVTVITILGDVVKAMIQKKTNPLNGTLTKLDTSIGALNTTLVEIKAKTANSDTTLIGHTEKLIVLSTTVAQLAAQEARQTDALIGLKDGVREALTGCTTRIIDRIDRGTDTVIDACSPRA